jgi:hypothetical protein
MIAETEPCLLSCSVLKDELKALVKRGALCANIAFYSMELHSDFCYVGEDAETEN